MYLTIRQYQTDRELVEDILAKDQKDFVPLISSAAGFRDYYCIDNGNGMLTSVSVFENRSDGDKFNTLALEWVRNNLASDLPTSPKVTSGDVRTHATGKVLAS